RPARIAARASGGSRAVRGSETASDRRRRRKRARDLRPRADRHIIGNWEVRSMNVTRRSFLGSGAAIAGVMRAGGSMANDRVQVGFIGAGARAHELIEALQVLPGVEITGVVDAYRGRVERAIERTNGR